VTPDLYVASVKLPTRMEDQRRHYGSQQTNCHLQFIAQRTWHRKSDHARANVAEDVAFPAHGARARSDPPAKGDQTRFRRSWRRPRGAVPDAGTRRRCSLKTTDPGVDDSG
jgi:hypothetical protein